MNERIVESDCIKNVNLSHVEDRHFSFACYEESTAPSDRVIARHKDRTIATPAQNRLINTSGARFLHILKNV